MHALHKRPAKMDACFDIQDVALNKGEAIVGLYSACSRLLNDALANMLIELK
ncbi:MAG: hypothetical protein V4660_12520 [Pseudomonadota bacterium]